MTKHLIKNERTYADYMQKSTNKGQYDMTKNQL